MLLNYQLLSQGYLTVSIVKEARLEINNALEQYAAHDNLQPSAEFVADLEEKQLDEYLGLV